MRKLISAAGAVLAVGAMLAGCSSGKTGNSSSGTSNAAASHDTKANLTYAVWDQNQVAAIKANLKGFNKEYPNIKVNVDVTPFGNYWTKLQTEASSSTLPEGAHRLRQPNWSAPGSGTPHR